MSIKSIFTKQVETEIYGTPVPLFSVNWLTLNILKQSQTI